MGRSSLQFRCSSRQPPSFPSTDSYHYPKREMLPMARCILQGVLRPPLVVLVHGVGVVQAAEKRARCAQMVVACCHTEPRICSRNMTAKAPRGVNALLLADCGLLEG